MARYHVDNRMAGTQQNLSTAYKTLAGVWAIRMGVSKKRGKRGTQSGEPGQPDLCLPGLGWIEVNQSILKHLERMWVRAVIGDDWELVGCENHESLRGKARERVLVQVQTPS